MRTTLAALVSLEAGVLLGAVSPAAASAQSRAPACDVRGSQHWLATRPSPLDSATVTLQGTIARVCYSRLSARGRSVDSLVPLGRAWRTGANEPTTITLTGTLSIGGAVLEAGRYVLLTVPQAGQWILVFHATSETEPARMFASLRQVAQGVGDVERLPSVVDRFTIRAATDGSEVAFLLEWGERQVRVPVRTAR